MFVPLRIFATLIAFTLLFHHAAGFSAIINSTAAATNQMFSANLIDAYNRIVNVNNQEFHDTSEMNTITFQAWMPSPSYEFAPFIVNSQVGGSLTITYPNAPTITQASDCNSLPKIILTSQLPTNYPLISAYPSPINQVTSSQFLINGVTSFKLNGVFLQVFNDAATVGELPVPNILISSSTTVTLTNICIADSDPASSPAQSSITFAMIGSLALTNWLYTRTATQTITFSGTTEINIQNFQLSFQDNNPTPIILFNSVGTSTIEGFKAVCSTTSTINSPSLMSVLDSTAFTLSTFSFQSCNLKNSETSSLEALVGTIAINNVNSVNITGITINNVITYRVYANTPPPLVLMKSVATALVQNYNGVCSSSTNKIFIPLILVADEITTSITVNSFNIASCNYSSSFGDMLANYYGNILINAAASASLNSITISKLLLSPHLLSSPAPMITITDSTSATLTGLTLSCSSILTPIFTPLVFGAINVEHVSINTLSLSGCAFIDSEAYTPPGSTTPVYGLFLVSSSSPTSTLNINGFTGKGLAFVNVLTDVFAIPPSIFAMQGVGTASIKSFSAVCGALTNTVYIPSVLAALSIGSSLVVEDFTLTNCNLSSLPISAPMYSNYSGNFFVDSAQEVSFNNVKINGFVLSPPSPTNNYGPLFVLSRVTGPASFTGLSLTCGTSTILTPIIVAALSSPDLELSVSTFSLTNCKFVGAQKIVIDEASGLAVSALFLISSITAFNVNGVTVTSSSFTAKTTDLQSAPSFFIVQDVKTVSIAGFSATCTSTSTPVYIPQVLTAIGIEESLAVSDLTLANCKPTSLTLYANYSGNFLVSSVPALTFSNIKINNFVLSPTPLADYSPIFFLTSIGNTASFTGLSLQCVQGTAVATPILLAALLSTNLDLSINDFTLSNCNFVDMEIFTVPSFGIQLAGLFIANAIKSMTVDGVTLTSTTFSPLTTQTAPSMFFITGPNPGSTPYMGALTIKNFYGVCDLLNSNPVYLPSVLMAVSLESVTISGLTLSNCNPNVPALPIYSSYYGNITILGGNTVTLSGINIEKLSLSPEASSAPYPIILLSLIMGTATVSDLSMSCDPQVSIRSPILLAALLNTNFHLIVTNFTLSNCAFAEPQEFQGAFGNIVFYSGDSSSKVTLSGATVTNINLSLKGTVNGVISSLNYATWTIVNALSAVVENIVVDDLSVDSYAQNTTGYMLLTRCFFSKLPEATTSIKNFTVSNSDVTGSLGAIVFTNSQDDFPLGSIILEKVTIDSSTFVSTNFFAFNVQGHSSNFTLDKMSTFKFVDTVVTNSVFEDTRLLVYVKIDTDLTVYANESTRLSFSNLTFYNNVLKASSDVSIIEVIGCQIAVQYLNISYTTITGTKFFTNSLRMASFFLTNSTFDHNILSSSAYFVGYLLDRTLYRILETDYTDTGVQKAETRPFLLMYCNFSNITLTDSTLIVSNNPMIIIANNTFMNITSTSSVIASFQKYSPPVPLPSGSKYMPFTSIEANMILKDLPEIYEDDSGISLYDRFNTIRTALTEAVGNQAVFFLVLQENNYTDIISKEGTSLIVISGLSLNSTYISIKSNCFANSSIDTPNAFSVLAISDINQLTMEINNFTNYSGKGNLMSTTSSSSIEQLLISRNTYTNISKSASYNIQSAICKEITIQNDYVSTIYAESSWIQIDCSLAQSAIALKDSEYKDMTVSSSPGKLLALNFLRVNIQKTQAASASLVKIDTCTFYNITLNKEAQGYIKGVFKNPVFIFTLSSTPITIEKSTFELLNNMPDDKIISISSPTISVADSAFSKLTFMDPTGGMNLLFSSSNFKNVTFSHNRANNSYTGGLMNLINPNADSLLFSMTFTDCLFEDNQGKTGALISLQESGIILNVENTRFIDNFANNQGNNSGIIQLSGLYSSNITFTNTTLKLTKTYSSTSSSYSSDFLDITAISNSLINITIRDHIIETEFSEKSSSFLKLMNGYNISFEMTNIHYNGSETPLKILTSSNSVFNGSFENLTVMDLKMLSSTPLFSLTTSRAYKDYTSSVATVTVKDSLFTGLNLESSIFYLAGQEDSSLDFSLSNTKFVSISSTISEKGGSVIQNNGRYLKNLEISNCEFQEISLTNEAAHGGVYYGPAPLSIKDCTFQDISVKGSGGVIYETAATASSESSGSRRILDQSSTPSFSITGSSFSSIAATNGGLFASGVASDSTINITNNDITDTKATSKGSVFYIINSIINASGNTFTDISDATDGGKYVYAEGLRFDVSTFGPVDSSSDFTFKPNYLEITVNAPASTDPIQYYEPVVSNGILTVKRVSTDSFQYTTFTAKVRYRDHNDVLYNVVDNTDMTETENVQLTLELHVKGSDSKRGIYSNCSSSTECSFKPSDLKLAGTAGDILLVEVEFKTKVYTTTGQFYVELRECLPGEIFISINSQCYFCPANQYSFNPTDPICKDCPPDGARCMGGTNIVVHEGWWRNATTNADVKDCDDEARRRCLGEDKCEEGFTGPVCFQCDIAEGWITKGRGDCYKCTDNDSAIISTGVLLLCASIIYQIYVLYTTSNDNRRIHEEEERARAEASEAEKAVKAGSYILILTTYSQIISVIMKLQKSHFLEDQFAAPVETVGNPNTQVLFSLECLYALSDNDPVRMLRAKLLIYVFSPLAKIAVILIFELIRAIIKRNEEGIKEKIICRLGLAAVVLTMLEQPGIIGMLSAYLSCSPLYTDDPNTYITSNTLIQCNDENGDYAYFRNVLVIPGLLFWGFLVPFIIFLILWKKKKELQTSARYGWYLVAFIAISRKERFSGDLSSSSSRSACLFSIQRSQFCRMEMPRDSSS